MEIISPDQLNQKEEQLLKQAFESSKRSNSDKGHKLGCALLSSNGETFQGATNVRTRAIGLTCAERMAVDQLKFNGNTTPELCAVTGFLVREGWKDSYICTPCGVCLEMFWELILSHDLEDLPFVCSSWNKERILKANLTELYPQVGKGRWERE
ncbi:MAG: hypothetical protein ABEI53_00670 [Candidatus Magasanikbacteria bacterium]